MISFAGKRIVLGIGGGIAAYKCADLTRRLIEKGADVRIVMTQAGKEFITPLTLQALSGHPVAHSLLDPSAEASMGHIELAKWADLVVIAPATADLIARIAAGMGNDLLTTLCLATSAPVAIAPAMNQQMYNALATQENLATLKRREHPIWGPGVGEQACGDIGAGRMLEPMQILEHINAHFKRQEALINQAQKALTKQDAKHDLSDLSLLITAGPTIEALDPTRFISNHSSGKMGYAIAKAAALRGAKVTLISGPVALETPEKVERINVKSAQEMLDEVMLRASSHSIFIGAAAVADFRPAHIAAQKIKKTNDANEMQLTLIKNPDIVATVAGLKEQRPFTIGFAAETEQVAHYAKTKLQTKNLDLICANDVSIKGQGFSSDNNALHLYWPEGDKALPLSAKSILADTLLTEIYALYCEKSAIGFHTPKLMKETVSE